MRKILLKMFCVLSVVGYTSIALADCGSCGSCCPPPPKPQCEPCRTCEICPPCEPCKPCCTDTVKTGEPCNCAYNAPARIDPACGWDVWVTGSFIYWQAKEKGLDLGYHYYNNSAQNFTNYKAVNMDFDYIPGFKIGAGLSFCRDDWTLYLEYTRLNKEQTTTRNITNIYGTSNYLLSSWVDYLLMINNTANYDLGYLKGKWKLDYNLFDLDLGRPYYLGRKLIFKPFFGLRAGWIDQTFNVKSLAHVSSATITDTTNLYSIYSNNEQNTWLIGPRTGLGTDWLIGCNFRLFGNVAGALMYQNFDVSTKQHLPKQFTAVTTDQVMEGKDEMGYITPNVDFSLGVGYGSYFFCDQWYFDLTIGYDFNYFWNQNMMRHLNDALSQTFDHELLGDFDAGNLMLHGLTITAEVDF